MPNSPDVNTLTFLSIVINGDDNTILAVNDDFFEFANDYYLHSVHLVEICGEGVNYYP